MAQGPNMEDFFYMCCALRDLDLNPTDAQSHSWDHEVLEDCVAVRVPAKRKFLQLNDKCQLDKRARLFEEECLRARVNDIGSACTTRQVNAASRLQALAERVRAKAGN